METNFFQRTSIKDYKYIIEEVKQLSYDLKVLQGKAKITHVGGNGRFKFELGGLSFISTFNKNVCTNKENNGFNKEDDEYFDYFDVEFDRNIEKEWSELYIYHEDKVNYWKAI